MIVETIAFVYISNTAYAIRDPRPWCTIEKYLPLTGDASPVGRMKHLTGTVGSDQQPSRPLAVHVVVDILAPRKSRESLRLGYTYPVSWGVPNEV